MLHYRFYTQVGFSLVEMIVALAVFSIVITTAVGALLMLVATNQQLQAEQSVMTNLSFALDSMTREIRTGTNYFCESRPNFIAGPDRIFSDGINQAPTTDLDSVLANRNQPCDQGNNGNLRLHGIAFNEGGGSITGSGGRILYFFDKDEGKIFRRVGAGLAQSIVSSGIHIVNAEFYITGTEPLSTGDEGQPTVTIFIQAQATSTASKPYEIQTTITQRTLDI